VFEVSLHTFPFQEHHQAHLLSTFPIKLSIMFSHVSFMGAFTILFLTAVCWNLLSSLPRLHKVQSQSSAAHIFTYMYS
jgi:hypothetical protein